MIEPTLQKSYQSAIEKLQLISKAPAVEVKEFFQDGLSIPWVDCYSHSDKRLSLSQQRQLENFITRRLSGEPLAYILKRQGFWTLNLKVNQDVLIPRPETEHVVEWILRQFPQDTSLTIADLGTGAGTIALAVASERPHWSVWATDKSVAALKVAQENAVRLTLTNVHFVEGHWCDALPRQPFDLIASNPPYIKKGDVHLNQGDVRFEPRLALESGEDGLEAIREILVQSLHYLKAGGWLVLEHGYDQFETVKQLFQQAGYIEIIQIKDYSGRYRVIAGQWRTIVL